jgi:hypothetical protein
MEASQKRVKRQITICWRRRYTCQPTNNFIANDAGSGIMHSKLVSFCISDSNAILTRIALSDLAPIIEEFTEQVLIRLRGHEGSPVPLHEYMSFYTYDTLATLAFGKPMGFIKGEQNDEAQAIHDMMNGTLAAFGLLQHLPWMLKAMDTIGSLAGPMKQWRDWSVSQMKARMAVNPPPFYPHAPNSWIAGERF